MPAVAGVEAVPPRGLVLATHLECTRCGCRVEFSPTAYLCPECGPGGPDEDPGILDVRYDYPAAGAALRNVLRDGRRRDLFRFLPVLPLETPEPVLLAGGTPLLAAPRLADWTGVETLLLKDETRNPTRSLKDRATAIGVSLALTQGRDTLYCASAGNAAISLAGFCAHRGLACHVFVPAGTSSERLAWLERYGADVHRTRGSYDEAYAEAEARGAAQGWYSRNCAFNPFLVEGKKTAAYEIAEQLGWRVPDLVAAPVGDGCTLGAIGKGFRELEAMGFTARTPRLLGAQPAAAAPLVQRFGGEVPDPGPKATRAASIDVRRPRNARRVLAEVTASGGSLLAVPDEAMEEAQQALAERAGIVAELASAAALAALRGLAAHGALADATAVVVVTGGRVG